MVGTIDGLSMIEILMVTVAPEESPHWHPPLTDFDWESVSSVIEFLLNTNVCFCVFMSVYFKIEEWFHLVG